MDTDLTNFWRFDNTIFRRLDNTIYLTIPFMWLSPTLTPTYRFADQLFAGLHLLMEAYDRSVQQGGDAHHSCWPTCRGEVREGGRKGSVRRGKEERRNEGKKRRREE